ncbi:MAG: LytTR family DNA-binding domain-containing protein [Actinomycetota bacterium]|nr:LytTR family DNA-binding domain-containing protein [Actinomycetota bacterium]
MTGDRSSAGLDVLVVDDEPPAREDLAYLLRQHPQVGMVTTAGDATEALRRLRDERFDALFLDIRMPGLDGLELARVLSRFAHPPDIVFVSAYENHAVDAFELAAVDYLLKPVRPERLSDAIRRLSAGHQAAARRPEDPGNRIAVEMGGRTRLVERDSIHVVESSGDYVRLHSESGSYLLRTPISSLEESWRKAGFVRVHRRYLIALRHLTELRVRPGGGYVMVVGGRELPVSRRHTRELRELIAGSPVSRRSPA